MRDERDCSFSRIVGHEGVAIQTHNLACRIVLGALLGISGFAPFTVFADHSKHQSGNSGNNGGQPAQLRDDLTLLSGDRIVIGTVVAVRGQQIEVQYPDSLQPRYLPLDRARERGMELKAGDAVRMVFNEQQILVDFHPLGKTQGKHHILSGTVAEQMKVGQERVVIERESGGSATFAVRPLIRSKVAALPISVPAVFLLDESNQV